VASITQPSSSALVKERVELYLYSPGYRVTSHTGGQLLQTAAQQLEGVTDISGNFEKNSLQPCDLE